MHPRIFSLRLLLPAALLACCCIALGASVTAFAQEPEILKGTVKSIDPGVLLLKDVDMRDEAATRKDVKVLWDKETAFFYGGTKVPREEVAPGYLVLVKCVPSGSERKALSVRVIKGK